MAFSGIERELHHSRDTNPNEVFQLRTRIHAHLSRKAVAVQRMMPGRFTKLPAVAIEYFDLMADVVALAWDYSRNCRYIFGSTFSQALPVDSQLPRLFADLVTTPSAEFCRSRLLHVLVRCLLTRLSMHPGAPVYLTPAGDRGLAFRQCCVVMAGVLDDAMSRISPQNSTPTGNMTQIGVLDIVDFVSRRFKDYLDFNLLQSTFNRLSIVQHCEFKLPFELDDNYNLDGPYFPHWEEMYDSLIEESDDCCHSFISRSGSDLVAAIGTKAIQAFSTYDDMPESLRTLDRQLLRPLYVLLFLHVCYFSVIRMQARRDEEAVGSNDAAEPEVASIEFQDRLITLSEFYDHHHEWHTASLEKVIKMAWIHFYSTCRYKPEDSMLALSTVGVTALLLQFSIHDVPEDILMMHNLCNTDQLMVFGTRMPGLATIWRSLMSDNVIRVVEDSIAGRSSSSSSPSACVVPSEPAPVDLQNAFSFVNDDSSESAFVCTICTDLIYFGSGAQFHLVDNCSQASARSEDDKLACGQMFCKPCIQEWLSREGSSALCPVCHHRIAGSFVHKGRARQAMLCDAPPYVYEKLKQLPMTCNGCDATVKASALAKHRCLMPDAGAPAAAAGDCNNPISMLE